MTIHHVTVVHTRHRCPASAELHVIDTVRTVVMVIPGGPCKTPVRRQIGDTVRDLPCGRLLPAQRQCRACRNQVVTTNVTYVDPEADA
jgi:hypothetical protein